jgi:hypothetical protein
MAIDTAPSISNVFFEAVAPETSLAASTKLVNMVISNRRSPPYQTLDFANYQSAIKTLSCSGPGGTVNNVGALGASLESFTWTGQDDFSIIATITNTEFPHLKRLSLINFSGTPPSSMPNTLEYLSISAPSWAGGYSSITLPPNLISLELSFLKITQILSWPATSLLYLSLSNMAALNQSAITFPSSLLSVSLTTMSNITAFPSAIANLNNLQSLEIVNCENLNLSDPANFPPLQSSSIHSITIRPTFTNKLTNPNFICDMLGSAVSGVKELLVAGRIPSCFMTASNPLLTSLTIISFNDTSFNSTLFATQFQHLEQLSIAGLSGAFPNAIKTITSLRSLTMTSTSLSGEIDADFFSSLPLLTDVTLESSRITGAIPDLGNVQRAVFSSNQFSSWISPTPTSAASLQTIAIASNTPLLSIPTDQSFSYMTNLTSLSISATKLDRTIPSSWLGLPVLVTLRATLCGLYGNLTAITAPRLETLYLDYNNLCGVLPDIASEAIRLNELHLSHNYFTGSIPDSWATNLVLPRAIDLTGNLLSGSLGVFDSMGPALKSSWSSITLKNNFFTGPMFDLSTFTSLLTVDVSSTYVSLCGYNNVLPRNPPLVCYLANTTDFSVCNCTSQYLYCYQSNPSLCTSTNTFTSVPAEPMECTQHVILYPADPTSSPDPTSCPLPAPSPMSLFTCDPTQLRWISTFLNSNTDDVVIFSPVTIGGNLTVNTLTFSTLSSSVDLSGSGCLVINGSITVELTQQEFEQLQQSQNPKSLLIQSDGTVCDLSGLSGVPIHVIASTPSKCDKISATGETSSRTLSAAFLIEKTKGCAKSNTWWIILASVLGAIALIVIVLALIFIFNPTAKNFIRPYANRSSGRLTNLNPHSPI